MSNLNARIGARLRQLRKEKGATGDDYILCRTNIRQENRLTPEINALLDSYDNLNDNGKAALRLYLDFLLSNESYKKDADISA